MSHGGVRPGAGRPKGRRSRKTEELLATVVGDGLTPLSYLLEVMRDDSKEEATRLDAAKSAAPYVHPRLAAVDNTHTGKDGGPILVSTVDADL